MDSHLIFKFSSMRISQLVGGLAVLLLIGGGCARVPAAQKQDGATANVQIVENGYGLENEAIINSKHMLVGSKYTLVSPQGATSSLPTAVEQKLRANNQVLASFNLPVDPSNSNVVYLSTAQVLEEGGVRVLDRVYRYNVQNHELTEIFKFETEGMVLRMIGRVDTNLIMLEQGFDDSPGPCTSIWSSYSDSMRSLAMHNPAEGLQKFTVPAEKVQAGKQEEEQCAKEME